MRTRTLILNILIQITIITLIRSIAIKSTSNNTNSKHNDTHNNINTQNNTTNSQANTKHNNTNNMNNVRNTNTITTRILDIIVSTII